MILEGVVTTRNEDGSINLAPQGPIVPLDVSRLTFRPFPPSLTYQNLKRTRCGVFHVVDDVLLIAQTALNLPVDPPELLPAVSIDGAVLSQCCRWYEFEIVSIDESGERPIFEARVVHHGRVRDSFGFNRARHAVIEATIAATRVHLLGRQAVLDELSRLEAAVQKTGGEAEREAFRLVVQYVQQTDA